MKTISFEFYQNEFEGKSVPEESWDRFSLMARLHVENVIGSKLPGDLEEFQDNDSVYLLCMAICEVAEYLYEYKDMPSSIKSESTDGYSVTYGESSGKEKYLKVKEICRNWLGMTGLMYAGFSQSR